MLLVPSLQVIAMGATPLTPTIALDGKEGIVTKSKKFAVDAGCTTEADWDSGSKFDEIMTCLKVRSRPVCSISTQSTFYILQDPSFS